MMMMFWRNAFLHKRRAFTASSSSFHSLICSSGPCIVGSCTGITHPQLLRLPHQQQPPLYGADNHNHQQRRHRWTKAKKKRYARHERRQELEQQGKSLPKPPYFFPRDTPVVNVRSKEQVALEKQQWDAQAAAEMHEKVQAQAQQPVLRHHMTLSDNNHKLVMSDRVRKLFDLMNGNQREVVQAQKQRGMQLFQWREGDTGSSATQVVALTTRIQQLQTHKSRHPKDLHSRRGMDALYVRRRKVLDYMERKDFDAYRHVVKTLGLVR